MLVLMSLLGKLSLVGSAYFLGADALTGIDRFHLVEVAILFAAIGYVTQTILDLTGRSRSSQTLRKENEDLVRRNKELELEVGNLSHELGRMEADVKALRSQVADLSERDQKAVLEALRVHEQRADQRWEGTAGVLTDIRDVLKGGLK